MLITLSNEKNDIPNMKSKKQLTWPASTKSDNLRTLHNITAIVEEIERNPDLVKNDPDFCKGFKGRSLFLDQPQFHIVKDLPAEYMHSLCLGTVKRVIILTFKTGENRDRVTKRKLSDTKLFNEQTKLIQLSREFSRRCCSLDLSVMKASEYRNIVLFFFQLFSTV